jgi:hypothetical protein
VPKLLLPKFAPGPNSYHYWALGLISPGLGPGPSYLLAQFGEAAGAPVKHQQIWPRHVSRFLGTKASKLHGSKRCDQFVTIE